MTGDRKAAELCNVVDTGNREDAYQTLYRAMTAKVGAKSTVDKELVKKACMTSLYGSEAQPKEAFGTGPLLKAFYETMEENAPAAWELNSFYLEIWDSERYTYHWVMPDNGNIVIKVMDSDMTEVRFLDTTYEVISKVHRPKEKGRSLSAHTTHATDGLIVREMSRRCNYDMNQVLKVIEALQQCDYDIDPKEGTDTDMVLILWDLYEKSGYLSARILDHLTKDNAQLVDHDVIWELIESLPNKPFEVLSIHDCFRCLPGYGNDLRKQYNLQLHLIARSNLLSFLLTQIIGQECNVGKLDYTLAADILNANYSLA